MAEDNQVSQDSSTNEEISSKEKTIKQEDVTISNSDTIDDTPDDGEKLDLKKLAENYRIEKEKPRPMYIQLMLTFGLVFGPIFLALDLAIPNFLGTLGDTLLPVFIVITSAYIGSSFYLAWRKSKDFD